MPLIDVRCLTCGEVTEVHRPLAMYPETPVCPTCGKPTEQVHLPKSVRWTPDPVIVFKAPDGSFRFPGDPNGRSASNYTKQGFERVEIRGATEMRRFETHMNRSEYSRAQRQVEQKLQSREIRESRTRSTLRDLMTRMTPFGQDVARAAMQRNDSRPRERASEAGFCSEVYSFDRSSREESRDPQGRRRRD